MKLIKYISKTKLGRLGVWHNVVTLDDKKYYSWEYEWFLKNWRFKIYTKEELEKDCAKIISIEDVPDIDMEKYCNLRKDWYNCIEIIDYLYKKENMKEVWLMNRICQELWRILLYIILVLLWIIIWMHLHNTYFVISEEEYINNPSSIEFDKK